MGGTQGVGTWPRTARAAFSVGPVRLHMGLGWVWGRSLVVTRHSPEWPSLSSARRLGAGGHSVYPPTRDAPSLTPMRA